MQTPTTKVTYARSAGQWWDHTKPSWHISFDLLVWHSDKFCLNTTHCKLPIFQITWKDRGDRIVLLQHRRVPTILIHPKSLFSCLPQYQLFKNPNSLSLVFHCDLIPPVKVWWQKNVIVMSVHSLLLFSIVYSLPDYSTKQTLTS